MALLEPTAQLRELEARGDYTSRLALQEEIKTLPFGAVWDAYCESTNVPRGQAWVDQVKKLRAGRAVETTLSHLIKAHTESTETRRARTRRVNPCLPVFSVFARALRVSCREVRDRLRCHRPICLLNLASIAFLILGRGLRLQVVLLDKLAEERGKRARETSARGSPSRRSAARRAARRSHDANGRPKDRSSTVRRAVCAVDAERCARCGR